MRGRLIDRSFADIAWVQPFMRLYNARIPRRCKGEIRTQALVTCFVNILSDELIPALYTVDYTVRLVSYALGIIKN